MKGWLTLADDGDVAVFIREESAEKYCKDNDAVILCQIPIFERYRPKEKHDE